MTDTMSIENILAKVSYKPKKKKKIALVYINEFKKLHKQNLTNN